MKPRVLLVALLATGGPSSFSQVLDTSTFNGGKESWQLTTDAAIQYKKAALTVVEEDKVKCLKIQGELLQESSGEAGLTGIVTDKFATRAKPKKGDALVFVVRMKSANANRMARLWIKDTKGSVILVGTHSIGSQFADYTFALDAKSMRGAQEIVWPLTNVRIQFERKPNAETAEQETFWVDGIELKKAN